MQNENQTTPRGGGKTRVYPVVVGVIVAVAALAWFTSSSGDKDKLVVYCAHDSIYSEKIFRKFVEKTGIPVSVRFDTEATKSLGLTELLIREKDAPRCDVFWNNELVDDKKLFARLKEVAVKVPSQSTAGGSAR